VVAHRVRAVNRIVEISDAGRAPKNDPAIFALALAVTHGDAQAKAHAFANLIRVCRIGTHLIAGSCISAREASAAMALITAEIEPECEIIAFSAPAQGGYGGMHGGGEPGITRVNLSPRMRLAEVIKRIEAIPMGGTDCALPMVWAARNKLNVSAFITYTDSETWAGNIHPAQALRQYRDEFVGDAKAVVVGMTSNGFTLADPNDRGMLDVVGFDTTVPAVIADFVRE
jgi:60 kDa SS-A/Ro ribonucleoprotein